MIVFFEHFYLPNIFVDAENGVEVENIEDKTIHNPSIDDEKFILIIISYELV